MPWLCWELLFSLLHICCMNKGSYLNLEHMLSGNYVMIMSMLMFIYVCIYVSMSLFDRVIKDRPCGGMIAYAGEWHEEVHGLTRNQLRRVVLKNTQGHYHTVMS